MALFVATGPLASFLAGAGCLALFLTMNPSASSPVGDSPAAVVVQFLPRGMLAFALCLSAVCNLGTAAWNLVPARFRMRYTDGAILLYLAWHRSRAARDLELTLLMSAMTRGLRPRDWDGAQIERLLASRDGSAGDAGVNLCGYYHAIDRDRVDLAGELLDLAAGQQRELPAVLVEMAYFEGFHRRNAEAARAALRRLPAGEIEFHTVVRAKAACSLAEGNYREATRLAKLGLEASQRSRDLGGSAAERDLLQAIIGECGQFAGASA